MAEILTGGGADMARSRRRPRKQRHPITGSAIPAVSTSLLIMLDYRGHRSPGASSTRTTPGSFNGAGILSASAPAAIVMTRLQTKPMDRTRTGHCEILKKLRIPTDVEVIGHTMVNFTRDE